MALPRQLTSYYHLSHYFILAYFFLLAYPSVLRPSAIENDRAERYLLADGFICRTAEMEVFIGTFLFFCWEMTKDVRSFDEGVHRFLLDCKILSLLLAFLTGNDYFMFGLVALYASMAMLLAPPPYEGKSNVTKLLNQEMFDETVLRNYDKAKPYLVMFQSKWDAECHFITPYLCQLSVELQHRMHFGTMDIASCPDLARALLIEDEQHMGAAELPVLILFHRGKEVRRLPEINEMTGKAKKVRITKQKMISHFELDTTEFSQVPYLNEKKDN